ncbi:MAG: hypothetical protein AMJ60_11405 [Desulfobacterales bacterium SG8_35]|nr:MAG: hypothetical protein AMJ60_11405 [Desulfobacterales bacterium SG8_35]
MEPPKVFWGNSKNDFYFYNSVFSFRISTVPGTKNNVELPPRGRQPIDFFKISPVDFLQNLKSILYLF